MSPQGDSFGARFGRLVRRRRGIEGLTQEELAARAFPGGETSASLVSVLESGRTARPQQKTIDALAIALNLTSEDIAACHDPSAALLEGVKAALSRQEAAFAEQRDTVEAFRALLANPAFLEFAEKRGLTIRQIENLLTRFGHAGAPIEQAEKLLLGAADQLDEIRARLALLSTSDPSVEAWKKSALDAIDLGDFDEARRLFRQAVDRDVEAVQRIEASRLERRLSASDSMAHIARLESAEAAFSKAAKGFESAARLVEPVDLEKAWWHWIDAAAAHARGAEVFPDIAASRAAVEVVRRHTLPLAVATNNPIKLQRARYELAEDLLALSACVPEDEASPLIAEALIESRLAFDALPADANSGLQVTGLLQVGAIELAIARATTGAKGVASARSSVATFRKALAITPTDAACLNRLGSSLRALSDRVDEPEAGALLDEATSTYRRALDNLAADAPPSHRASVLSLLGAVYIAQADRAGANLQVDHLQTARFLFEQAIEALDPAVRPLSWAQAQGNIAIIERRLATGVDRADALRKVIARYRTILTIYSREQTAEEWGSAKNNLGSALTVLAIALDYETAVPILREAISELQEAMSVRSRSPESLRILNVQNNLALAYRHLGGRLEGDEAIECIRTSIATFHAVLAGHCKETELFDWTASSVNLALSEGLLAHETGQSDLLEAALRRLDEAIVFYENEGYAAFITETRRYRTMLEPD